MALIFLQLSRMSTDFPCNSPLCNTLSSMTESELSNDATLISIYFVSLYVVFSYFTMKIILRALKAFILSLYVVFSFLDLPGK